MQRFVMLTCMVALTIVAFIINDELFGLITVASWALAFCVKLFVSHEEYRSYRANR